MRRFVVLAATIWLVGCGSRGTQTPESSGLEQSVTQTAAPEVGANLPPADRETLQSAATLTAEGKLASAVELLSNFIGAHPECADAFRLRAQASALRRNDADALADFSMAIKLEPDKVRHYLNRGMFQLSHGNTSPAIDDFNQALKLEPKNVQAFVDRGMARVTIGEVKTAISDFNQAIESDPKCVGAYTNRSFAWIKLDRRNDALADLDRAIELDPKAAGAYDSRGVLRLEMADNQKALADFTSAVKLEANNPTYLAHRRAALVKLERYVEAQADASRIERLMRLSALNEAVFRDRLSPKPYLARGEFLLEEGQIAEAITNFDHALSLDSKQWEALVGRARAALVRGDFQKAVEDSSTALAIEPQEDAYAVRGDAYRKLGEYAKAVADYDAAHRIDGDVAETWLLYSRALHRAGSKKEASEALKRSQELQALEAPRTAGRVEQTAKTTAK